MTDLEERLKESQSSRFRLIATDGVFSMDGSIANLKEICNLADKYNAMVMIDDSHAVGFMGKHGKGTHEYRDVIGRIDIITGTLGKALGGASGGYLFSNTVAPSIISASLKVLDLLKESTHLRDRLEENTKYFREGITKAGLNIKEGVHPIVPIMLGDAALSQKMASRMLEKGTARIRVQISAAHSKKDLDFAINAFKEVKEEFHV